MKKVLALMMVLGMTSSVNAQLELLISGPDSLATNATGTYTVSYSGISNLVAADVDIVVDFGSIGGGIILTTNRDAGLDATGINSATGNYEVSITNDVAGTNLGSPLFSIVLTAPSVVPDGNKVTISLLENSFIDTDWNPITGTVMPTKQVTITSFITDLRVTKCMVKAGKTQYIGNLDFNDMKDAFTASGTINGFPADLNTISNIDVNIISADGNSVFFEANDFNYARDVKKDKFTHKYKIGKGNKTEGAITSMVVDFKKKTFAISATNLDLTGLYCPLRLIISMDDFILSDEVNETIVNGRKTLIPTRLTRMYKDALVVSKAKTRNGRKSLCRRLKQLGDGNDRSR